MNKMKKLVLVGVGAIIFGLSFQPKVSADMVCGSWGTNDWGEQECQSWVDDGIDASADAMQANSSNGSCEWYNLGCMWYFIITGRYYTPSSPSALEQARKAAA